MLSPSDKGLLQLAAAGATLAASAAASGDEKRKKRRLHRRLYSTILASHSLFQCHDPFLLPESPSNVHAGFARRLIERNDGLALSLISADLAVHRELHVACPALHHEGAAVVADDDVVQCVMNK